MTRIQVELEKRDTEATRTEVMREGMKSMAVTELEIWISMIPRGQGMMMAHITIQGGIVKIAILEMNIETEGVTECKMYLQLVSCAAISCPSSEAKELGHLLEQSQSVPGGRSPHKFQSPSRLADLWLWQQNLDRVEPPLQQ
jgi:hypothetical protein